MSAILSRRGPRRVVINVMHRLRLRYQDGLNVEDRLAAINDGDAARVLALLFEASLDLREAEVLTADGRRIAHLTRGGAAPDP